MECNGSGNKELTSTPMDDDNHRGPERFETPTRKCQFLAAGTAVCLGTTPFLLSSVRCSLCPLLKHHKRKLGEASRYCAFIFFAT